MAPPSPGRPSSCRSTYCIKTFPNRLEQDYNAGRTTQVPTGRVVGIQGRLRRKLGYNGITLSFERA